MTWFTLGVLLLVAGWVAWIVATPIPKFVRGVILVASMVLGIVAITGSTTIFVGPGQGGIVTVKFGADLQGGHLVAINGEKGPQADVLPPGYHFGYWPWNYNLEAVPNIEVKEGSIGIVTAKDGKPLPENEIYAAAWDSPTEMLDARSFMTKNGHKGPQLTVLPPGQYRYNPKLFDVTVMPCLDIPIGQVGVVRANAGLVNLGNNISSVNGVPLVPKGCRGIWDVPLLPGKYYLHPNAYQVVLVKTTKRVYSYTSKGTTEGNASKAERDVDNSIHVRSQDSFQFPVDVRVAVMVNANDAPYVVAVIGDPDKDVNNDGFDGLEERAILPSIRAILRNSAEKMKAIQYVNSRSSVEKETFEQFQKDMERDKVKTEQVYLADIRLDATPEGKKLLTTQTDKEIAVQEQTQYKEQVLAENERANRVKAAEAADQQKSIQESLARITVEQNLADAAKNKAQGDAAQSLVYDAKVKALGGVENFTRLEIAKMAFESLGKTWKGELPAQVIIGGSSSGSLTDVMTGVFANQLKDGAIKEGAKK